LGQRSVTVYDPAGNVASATDFNGNTISFEYDLNNRLIDKHLPDGTSVHFSYTVTGQEKSITDFRGVTDFEYDARDRLLARTDPDGQTISYTYDKAGNRTSVTTAAGATQYTFDALNRQETVTDPELGVTRYTYDGVGNLIRTDFPNGTTETRQYDALDRLTFLKNFGPLGVISSYAYTLDAAGKRTAVLEDTGRKVQYLYDPLYRLTSESITDPVAGNRTIGYSYDPVGNRLSRTDSAEGLTIYGYDDNDRLLFENLAGDMTLYTYDNNGNTLSRFHNSQDNALFRWDFENRLVGADVIDATGTHHITNQYDSNGIRTAQIVDGQETRFLIDTVQPYAQVLMEYRPSGLITVSYVYGRDLISQNRGGVKSFYHVDGLGSTRALTDGSGAVTDRYVYDAFGRMIGRVGSTENLYLFAGEQREAITDLYYLRTRYGNVGTGRFVSRDTFAGALLQPETLHRYLYANANPINLIDPSGEIGLETAIALISYSSLAIQSFLAPAQFFSSFFARKIKIGVYLPEDRDDTGIMNVSLIPGVTWFALALGRGTNNAKDPRDTSPTTHNWWEYGGDTPTGEYTGSYSSQTVTSGGSRLGPYGAIWLTPTPTGNDHADQAYRDWNRFDIGIHGGSNLAPSDNWYPLRPTFGCIRVLDRDMWLLAIFAKRAKVIDVSVLGPQGNAPP
jgi:RHS repeat-associated protein